MRGPESQGMKQRGGEETSVNNLRGLKSPFLFGEDKRGKGSVKGNVIGDPISFIFKLKKSIYSYPPSKIQS